MNAYLIKTAGEEIVVAAKSLVHAFKFYDSEIGFNSDLYEEDESIEQIDEDKWENYQIMNTDYDEEDPNDKAEFSLKEAMSGLSEATIISTTDQD